MRISLPLLLSMMACLTLATGCKKKAVVKPPTTSMPSSAARDQPFINSLGMKFVPVEIVGASPTAAKVLVSVWETRVKDYQEFVTATNREWPKADFPQGDDHPAVKVTWEDANAFCEWLSNKENREYRLPLDHEWSCAIGIGGGSEKAEVAARDKSAIVKRYLWGKEWPPAQGFGNFSESMGVDTFPKTSPVGSFAPNNWGLYDLGGNVWEWCSDAWEKEKPIRVLRGGSWTEDDQLKLNASYRYQGLPTIRYDDYGFRVVLLVK